MVFNQRYKNMLVVILCIIAMLSAMIIVTYWNSIDILTYLKRLNMHLHTKGGYNTPPHTPPAYIVVTVHHHHNSPIESTICTITT